jgi:hypothetical protein
LLPPAQARATSPGFLHSGRHLLQRVTSPSFLAGQSTRLSDLQFPHRVFWPFVTCASACDVTGFSSSSLPTGLSDLSDSPPGFLVSVYSVVTASGSPVYLQRGLSHIC